MLQIILPSTNLARRRNQWMLILSFLHVNIQTHQFTFRWQTRSIQSVTPADGTVTATAVLTLVTPACSGCVIWQYIYRVKKFRYVTNHTLYGNIRCYWDDVLPRCTDTGRKFAWRKHKPTWRTVSMTEGRQPARTKPKKYQRKELLLSGFGLEKSDTHQNTCRF